MVRPFASRRRPAGRCAAHPCLAAHAARPASLSAAIPRALFSSLSAALLLGASFDAAPAEPGEYTPGYVQIELHPGVTIAEINADYETTTSDSLPPLYRLYVHPGTDEATLIQQMLQDSLRIAAAELCFRTDTPEGVRQMVVAAVGGTIEDYLDQDVVARLHLEEAHYYAQGEGVRVAILDSGVNFTHPALQGALETCGFDFVDDDADPSDSANGLDDDGDGEIDEGAGHGTMVAGIVRLVAPAARILPIRVLNDEGRGETFDVAKGIRFAREHGAKVINLSLGLYHHSDIIGRELEEVASANIAVAGAAGNDGTDSVQVYPAQDSEVFMVAALDSADVKADFSNYGSKVEVSAPGVGIRAPYYDGEWAIGAGTSFATPFVSGQCALLFSLNPALDWNELKLRLRESVVDIYQLPPNEPYTGELGTGRIDGYQLLVHSEIAAAADDGDPPGERVLRIWPNPAPSGSVVRISWRGLAAGTAGPAAAIYDAAGRGVARLRPRSAASGELSWDGRDARGRLVPAGLYFIRLADGAAPDRTGSIRIVR